MMKQQSAWLVVFIASLVATVLGQAPGRVATEASPRGEPRAAASCDSLASLKLPHTTITLARTVEAGASITDGSAADAAEPSAKAPRPFCRVSATLTPSSDSDIKMELWLPTANWNQKFQAVGNGAFSGSIAYPALVAALARGYAAASTDTGHVGNTASFALGHPEKLTDFAWRAPHEMADVSKRIIAAYYQAQARYSYWNGCSAGGRQALKAAQRFPADFDGIIAGAPGLDWTGRASQAVRVAKVLEADPSARLLEADRRRLHEAVVNACDLLDGVKDGLIGNPERCTFEPAVLQCKGSSTEGCLSAAQVSTARLIYSNGVNTRTGREIAGLRPGSELGWTDLGWTASARATGLDQFRFIVFADPRWTVERFNFDTDLVRAEEVDANTINALDPNVKPFFDRGGKLIQYHGWSDPQISPSNSTQYYSRVIEAVGGTTAQASYRLFMAPGMGHCGGGEGPNTFDMVAALEQWVEGRQAPDRILATHAVKGVVDRTRPLCPYPQIATYVGTGSLDEAASFVCRVP